MNQGGGIDARGTETALLQSRRGVFLRRLYQRRSWKMAVSPSPTTSIRPSRLS